MGKLNGKNLGKGIFVRDGVHWIRYVDINGKEIREKCGGLSIAKERLAIRRGEKAKGLEPERRSNILFSTLVADAVAHIETEYTPKGRESVKYILARLDQEFGPRRADTIRQQEIIAWLAKMQKSLGWSASTRNKHQTAFSLVYRLGVTNKKIRESAAKGIARQSEKAAARERYLSPDEEARLTAVIGKRYPTYLPIFQLAIHGGYRRSEQLRSVVGDLHPDTHMLCIHQRKTQSLPATRYVPASPIAIAAYNALAQGKAKGAKLCNKMRYGTSDTLEMNTTRNWFDRARAEAGVENFNWHDLRHTFASRLVTAGVPLRVVADYLGHANIQMTMRYSHLCPGNHDAARAALMASYAEPEVAPAASRPRRKSAARLPQKATGTFGVIRGGRAAR